jgi:putative transposase
MQPYSLEFRQRIIDTYAEENTSQRKLAQRFRVAPSFVQKILKQYRETGSIEPKQRLEQTPTKLNSVQLDILKKIVAANNDATLAELCDPSSSGDQYSCWSIYYVSHLREARLDSKKKHFIQARKKLNKSKYNAVNSGK